MCQGKLTPAGDVLVGMKKKKKTPKKQPRVWDYRDYKVPNLPADHPFFSQPLWIVFPVKPSED